MRTTKKVLLVLLAVYAAIFIALAIAPSIQAVQPSSPPGQGECEHGNSQQSCRPDPQPSNGQDCDEHGPKEGGVNEDHCLGGDPSVAPSPSSVVPSDAPSSEPSATTTPEPSATSSAAPSAVPPTTGPTSSATPVPTTSLTPQQTLPPTDTSAEARAEKESRGDISNVAAVAIVLFLIGVVISKTPHDRGHKGW